VLADDCGFAPDAYCTGESVQAAPSCVHQRAFPGAEGFGAESVGGRGGIVLIVDDLSDDPDDPAPGTLRHALTIATGPRTVVFTISGLIKVHGRIHVNNPYLTVAGQTAPGDGVVLKKATSGEGSSDTGGPLIQVNTHNVILRHLYLRRGDNGKQGDNLSIREGSQHVMIDHMSLAWGTDESLEIFANTNDGGPTHVSLERSLIAESLNAPTDSSVGHPLGGLISGYKAIDAWMQVHEISVHKNVWSDNYHRNPRVLAKGVKVINNLVYNWRTRAGSTARETHLDWISNVFKPGGISLVDERPVLFHESNSFDGLVTFGPASLHLSGNINPGHPDESELNLDNWLMVREHYYEGYPTLPLEWSRDEPLADGYFPVAVIAASESDIPFRVLDVGANLRLACDGTPEWRSNDTDTRLRTDILTDGGPTSVSEQPASTSDVEGYSDLVTFSDCLDADSDGMPASWEELQGLDDSDPLDRLNDTDGDGYTNLEEYLNATQPNVADRVTDSVSVHLSSAGSAPGDLSVLPSYFKCGTSCSHVLFTPGQKVRVQAHPLKGAYFSGWTAGPCTGNTSFSCDVLVAAGMNVAAAFEPGGLLRYRTTGAGSGSIEIQEEGQVCGSDCMTFPLGLTIHVEAVPSPGSVFVQWTTGKCTKVPNSPTNPVCSFNVPAQVLIKAEFAVE
jgi:pectate lyase